MTFESADFSAPSIASDPALEDELGLKFFS
jgi:hypothetical protein